MTPVWAAFVSGGFLGACVGVVIMCLLAVSRQDDPPES